MVDLDRLRRLKVYNVSCSGGDFPRVVGRSWSVTDLTLKGSGGRCEEKDLLPFRSCVENLLITNVRGGPYVELERLQSMVTAECGPQWKDMWRRKLGGRFNPFNT